MFTALKRAAGVIRRPRATFNEALVDRRWLGLLIGLSIAAAAANAAFLSTEVGRQALVDQWERTSLAFGQPVDDARYAELRTLSEYGPAYGVLSALVQVPVAIVAVAVVVYGVFGRRRGGPSGPAAGGLERAGFTAALALSVHAGTILAWRVIVSAPIAYARETTASATSLGTWFPGFDETSAVARLLGLIDLFAIWWAVVLAIGVSVLYGRPANRTAVGIVGIYLAIALGLTLVMAGLGRAA